MTAQTKEQFNSGMESYIEKTISDPQAVNKWREKQKKPFFPIAPPESDAKEMMRTELKHQYILDNMEEYLKAYFPERDAVMGMSSSDTLICDNGGFEDDFDYYFGYRTVFNAGSNTCTPTWAGNPSVYVPVSMPSFREFEIVGLGLDSLIGIQRVKFGDKALKLNDIYNHTGGTQCSGANGVNKLEKRFKVTEDNRDITVWYAVALENPSGHSNTQPYFSIRCDRAPLSDLCFDADILDCDSIYNDPNCSPQKMDVLDWSCHRIKIPKDMIDSIATLEIEMADCGLGGHNGYAYIDGICEDCTGSALGALILSEDDLEASTIGIDYISCDGVTARICGRYTAPFVCGEWYMDSVYVEGSLIHNVSIDTSTKIFCFDFDISNFGTEDEVEIYASGRFKREGGGSLPIVFSNDIILKKNLFVTRAFVNFSTSICYDNNTDTYISDDYYFVTLYVTGLENEEFSIVQRLLDGYPNESPFRDLGGGQITAEILLGPFLIQEGKWDMIVTVGNCTYIDEIVPPPYCSGPCEDFYNLLISNIDCDSGTSDTWSFKVQVPGFVGNYRIAWVGGVNPEFGIDDNIVILEELDIDIEKGCIEFTIEKLENGMPLMEPCTTQFTVCPPKPCSPEDCDIEAYVEKIECVSHLTNDYNILLNTDFDVTGKSLCYYTSEDANLQSISGSQWLNNNTGNITIYLVVCDEEDECDGQICEEYECFKILHVSQPDCSSRHFERQSFNEDETEIRSVDFTSDEAHEIKIIPNPIHPDELRIISSMENNNIEIYDMGGKLIFKTSFTGYEYRYNMGGISSGMYVLKYTTNSGEIKSQRFVK
jgi:hypothetical protein